MKKNILFPNLSPLASYSPLGQFIYMQKYTQEQCNKATKAIKTGRDCKIRSILVHELQHWLDHHATLVGIRNLLLIFNAYSAYCTNEVENFHHIRKLTLDLKKEEFKTYYSEIYNDIQGSFKDPWGYEYSTGVRFDFSGQSDESRPLLFIVFKKRNEKICRVPISIVSLMEAKALNVENIARYSCIKELPELGYKNEANLFVKEIESLLYNPDLTIYNAAVHVVSTTFKITDSVLGLEVTSLISSIALNFPEQLLCKVKIPTVALEWKERPAKMIENNDVGFVFWCLCINAASLKFEEITAKNVLFHSGIDLEDFVKEIKNEIIILKDKIFVGLFEDTLRKKINNYENYINKLGIHPEVTNGSIAFFDSDKPAVFYAGHKFLIGDFSTIELYAEIGGNNSDLYQPLVAFFEEQFEDFDGICGV